ncbi:uncharacterized protein LOC120165770 isoform X1 [Hibiscus syriacus]|uniref:uncharacterized protein LOC120165770 isoform X1 n=1 Tax=Hibiscus syriacus TaxID=106335 RepID=UPI001922742E|nr:uncharacterized protein LOC120165770 isoform X1 [Hibiscus syriacus]
MVLCRIDIQSNTRCFQSLYWYLLNEVALEPTRLNKIPIQVSYFRFIVYTLHIFVIYLQKCVVNFRPRGICTFSCQGSYSFTTQVGFVLFPFETLILNNNVHINGYSFYDVLLYAVEKLKSFIKLCPTFPNASMVGGPADILIIELADQLQKLKVEPVVLHDLGQIKVLRGMELRIATSTRLKTCLYSFTSPGGPMYPTSAVRHAARDALDLLFPVINPS